MTKALRYNEGKLKWSLLYRTFIKQIIEVLMFGAEKYAPNNWKKGMKRSDLLDSAERHLDDLWEGIYIDKDSGLSVVGHLGCNIMFFSYYLITDTFLPEEEGENE